MRKLLNRLAFLTATAIGLVPAMAAGQGRSTEADESDPEPIVVTGGGLSDTPSQIAYDAQTVDRDQLLSAPSGRLEDALTSIAGFQQFRRSDSRSANPSAQGATLRALGGNATSRALVLLDGVPMTDPFFGYVPFPALATDRVGMARVTRGGGSGPFGAGALAGTIELFSADAGALGHFGGQLLANDRGETEASAGVSTKLGEGYVSISGRWDRGMGFHTTPAADRVPQTSRSAFDSWSINLRSVAPVSDTIELQANGLIYEDDRTLRFEDADSSSEAQDASLRLVGRGAWQFDLIGYVQSRNFSNVVVSSSRFVPVLDQRNTPSTGIGWKAEVRPPVGDAHVLRLGSDYRRYDGDLYETAISAFSGGVTARRHAGGTNADFGIFLEDDWTSGALTLTGGARFDRFSIRNGFYDEVDGAGIVTATERFPDRTGWENSFRGGAVLRLSDSMRMRTVAYTGLRLPTLNELYRPFVVFPVVTQANAGLRNEKLEGYEIGIEVSPNETSSISFTAFDNRVKNAIANVTIGTNLRQRQNIDAINARGIEASTRLDLGPLKFNGSLSYTDATAQGSGFAAALDGKRPSQTPKWMGSATITYRTAKDLTFSATVRHVGAQFEDDLETDVLPAYTTLDAFANVPVTSRVSLILRGENLSDATIITRNQGGSIDLGIARTIWAGLKVALD